MRSQRHSSLAAFLQSRRAENRPKFLSFSARSAAATSDRTGVVMMSTRPHHEAVDDALWHLRGMAEHGDPEFVLEMGLCALLAIGTERSLSQSDYRTLLTAVLIAHAEAIARLSDQIEIRHINKGLRAAFDLIVMLFTGATCIDRHSDARAQVKIMIHRCRIVQHERDINLRRLQRQRDAVDAFLPAAAQDTASELFS